MSEALGANVEGEWLKKQTLASTPATSVPFTSLEYISPWPDLYIDV